MPIKPANFTARFTTRFMARITAHGMRAAVLSAALVSAAACTQTTGPDDTLYTPTPAGARPSAPGTASPPPGASGDDLLLARIGGLDRQKLEDGECGLFLWAALPARRLVFFQKNREIGAEMHLDGSVQTLVRQRAEGEQIYGLFPDQSFTTSDLTISLSLAADGLDPVTKGTMIRQASLRIDDSSGWTITMPVAGLIACQ